MDREREKVRHRYRTVAAAILVAFLAGAAMAQPSTIEGAAAVRAKLAREGRVTVIAQLARPFGVELSAEAIEAARAGLERELRGTGVTEVRGLGSLSFVALEVDVRQFEALLATGRVAAVAADHPVTTQ